MQVTDKETLKALARNLKRLRGERSYSEIARACGTHPANISKIEKAEHMPGLGLVTRIAECLGVSVDELLDKSSKKVASSA